MAMNVLRRLAAGAAAPVYPVIGSGAQAAVDELALHPEISLESSARHASLLFVAGALRGDDLPDLRRIHDQLPHPRLTVWWRSEPDEAFGEPIISDAENEPGDVLAGAYRQLILGERASESDLLPDEPPNVWRGKGDHGQGGEGMMGGVPYGRAMPMTDDDLQDGLALDAYTTEIGPFLACLPPGLKMQVTLQGDVIQTARIRRAPFEQAQQTEPAESLQLIARQLKILGLAALAERCLRAASHLGRGERVDLSGLRHVLGWSGALHAIPPALGQVGSQDVRDRFRAWCARAMDAGAPPSAKPTHDATPPRLVDLLPGLEWNEAILVINSFDNAALVRMCPVDPQEEEAADDKQNSDGAGDGEGNNSGEGDG